MKILFFTSPEQDYLQDSILHGLKLIYRSNLVDFPKKEAMYKGFEPYNNHFYGNGFSLYRLLDDMQVDRFDVFNKIRNSFFDLVIFSSIHRQLGLFLETYSYLDSKKVLVFDGEDSPGIFGYHGKYWRKKYFRSLPKAHDNFLYFKRELTPESIQYLWYKLISKGLAAKLPLPKNIRQISFSIPEEKIVKSLPIKQKDFPKHIVDEEVAKYVEGSYTRYAFDSEEDYYKDLQDSRFGITTKRSGWDCLRHYEIAANGAVICFRDLDKKPATCAPHGLIPGKNCISYSSWENLKKQINSINEEQYKLLQLASLEWANANTTLNRAKEVLKVFENNL